MRTGLPPFSLTTSGTDQEVIRLWMTVPPPCLASSRAATRAVIADGETGLAALVDDEAAVGVAVEGEAEVGAGLAHPRLEVDDVLRVERVGLVVGERAVQLEVHRDEFERQALEDRGDGVAAHAVARVDDDLQRADAASGPPGRAGAPA